MREPATVARRLTRALVFAALLSLTAVVAHALAGGMVPARGVVLASTAVLGVVVWPLTARRRHPLALVAAASLGQLALHTTYALSMRGASSAHLLSAVMCGSPHRVAPVGMAAMPMSSAPWSVGWMTLAHCVAAAVLVLVARFGEDAVDLVLRLLRARAIRFLVAAARPVRRPARPGVVTARPRMLLRSCGIGVRGPPLRAV